MKPAKEQTKPEARSESKEINFESDSFEENRAEDTNKEREMDESWDSRPQVETSTPENDSMLQVESVVKPEKVEINIDPSRTLTLKLKTSAKKKDEAEPTAKPKKELKEKKVKKDTVKVNDLIINKDLINSSRF